MPDHELSALSIGFRHRYVSYDELTAQVQSWARHFPEIAHLDSLGRTEEGRELWVMTVGPEPERTRPAVWADGNMHANELAGSSVALAIAEDAIRQHLISDRSLHNLSSRAQERARAVLFHIMPRMSPDGAERILKTGAYVRSVPRDKRPNRAHPRWRCGDVDGDGLALTMRREDPTGEYVESPEFPGLMLLRELDDDGPFYKLYPEGHIEQFDGRNIPSPSFLSDNWPDLNRNFPYSWAQEEEQVGAGPYPTSEPESRAVVEFACRHPNLFAWLNLHTFGGVYIRPSGHQPDTRMDRADLALYRQVAVWAEQLSGYPTVSGFEEFTYEPGKPLHGDLSDFAYHQRGCLSMVCELWDLFARLGIERQRPFVDHYTHIRREDVLRLAEWDREHNESRVFRPWRPITHPQLGAVDVGGLDTRVGILNPPYGILPEACHAQSALWLRVAALAPNVVIGGLEKEHLDTDTVRLQATVENHGYLPTYILNSAKTLEWNAPLYADLSLHGARMLEGEAHREMGHLDGWGRGRFGSEGSLFHLRSRGSTGRRILSWVVSGHGAAVLRVGNCRVGWVERKLDL